HLQVIVFIFWLDIIIIRCQQQVGFIPSRQGTGWKLGYESITRLKGQARGVGSLRCVEPEARYLTVGPML
ncbi:hypothetical protein, partial [Chloroflexus sp.]|uniref:hypothetical protein n=1 Tax=Chloroflexus sp. TaxID=1904827 RepID=UPI002ADDE6C7